MGAVLIACCCTCMATKEGLTTPGENKCEWIVPKKDYKKGMHTCNECPDGNILTVQNKKFGNAEIVKISCGKSA